MQICVEATDGLMWSSRYSHLDRQLPSAGLISLQQLRDLPWSEGSWPVPPLRLPNWRIAVRRLLMLLFALAVVVAGCATDDKQRSGAGEDEAVTDPTEYLTWQAASDDAGLVYTTVYDTATSSMSVVARI